MINSEKYLAELKQVKERLSRFDKRNRISNVLLFRDYLTKLDSCKVKLGFDSDKIYLGKGKSYHNVFLLIDSDWVTDFKSQQDFNFDLKINFDIELKGGRFYDDLFVYLFAFWELSKEFAEIKNTGLSNPYESVMRIVERAGFIYSQNGNIQIDNFTINNLEKYYSFSLPSLDYNFLDYIDEVSKLEGKIEIPNQQKTNLLWERFQNEKNN